ncbi:MAG: DUF1810 domain-containing protein [Ginsengibacter sp.]
MSLQRFLEAQQNDYEIALSEIKSGKKRSHWMWYIFPQIHDLGFSDMSKLYSIKSLNEAREYLLHPVLGKRLVEISQSLLYLPTDNAHSVFGSPDDQKLKSSMTLFAVLPKSDPVFQSVLEKFFQEENDEKTLSIIREEEKS